MLRNAFSLVLIIGLIACAPVEKSRNDTGESATKTDLGAAANTYVTSRLASYRAKSSPHCKSTNGEAKRVLVTGFAPFSGVTYNISGTVAGSLLNGYWPESFEAALPTEIGAPDSSLLNRDDYGARAQVAQVTIGGKSYEVCTLLLEVTWDLAASIIIAEASEFKPQMIIMSGADGSQPSKATFEARSYNRALFGSESYDHRGHALGDIAPISDDVVPGYSDQAGVGLPMTWNRAVLNGQVGPFVKAVNASFSLDEADSNPGSYICNNVSYVILSAIAGRNLSLAGGSIGHSQLGYTPASLAGVKAGFFHYPWAATTPAAADPAQIFAWSKVIAKAISVTLP